MIKMFPSPHSTLTFQRTVAQVTEACLARAAAVEASRKAREEQILAAITEAKADVTLDGFYSLLERSNISFHETQRQGRIALVEKELERFVRTIASMLGEEPDPERLLELDLTSAWRVLRPYDPRECEDSVGGIVSAQVAMATGRGASAVTMGRMVRQGPLPLPTGSRMMGPYVDALGDPGAAASPLSFADAIAMLTAEAETAEPMGISTLGDYGGMIRYDPM